MKTSIFLRGSHICKHSGQLVCGRFWRVAFELKPSVNNTVLHWWTLLTFPERHTQMCVTFWTRLLFFLSVTAPLPNLRLTCNRAQSRRQKYPFYGHTKLEISQDFLGRPRNTNTKSLSFKCHYDLYIRIHYVSIEVHEQTMKICIRKKHKKS